MAFNFGASSSPSLFGSSSTPASSASSLFGGGSAFGSSTGSSLFGSAFGAASSQSVFSGSSAPASSFGGFNFGNTSGNLFGASSAPFGQTQSAIGFGQQSSPSFQVAQQQAPASVGVLATVDNKQLTHYTKWEEINPQGLQQLLGLEEIIRKAKDESRQLEESARLQDSVSQEPGVAEAGLKHTLSSFSSEWSAQGESVAALNERVHELLQDTETAIRTFERSYRWRETAKANPQQVLPPSVRELLSGPVVLPSHFLRKAIRRFQENFAQYREIVAELERLVPLPAPGQFKRKQPAELDNVAGELSNTISNTHDLLYHVAAKMDALNERIDEAKRLHLEARRQAGDLHDPFAEALRRDQQRERAARNKLVVIPPAPQSAQPQTGAPFAAPPSSAGGGGAFGSSASPLGQPAGGLFAPQSGTATNLFGQDTSRASTSRSRKVKK